MMGTNPAKVGGRGGAPEHRSFLGLCMYIEQGYLVTAYRTQGAAPDLQAAASAADLYQRASIGKYIGKSTI